MAYKLWCHGLNGLSHDVHPTVRLEIPNENFGEFITEYLASNGRCNRIIGQYFVNAKNKCIGMPEIRVSSLLYIFNASVPEYRG